MIYLSAQPDLNYFIWQLEIQLINFKSLGIKKENIHILIGFNNEVGINQSYKKFKIEHEQFANIYFYADDRRVSNYSSSIRPHIIKKHFEKYKFLQEEIIFYHDSDILFSRIPMVELDGETCYVSDTRSYLDKNYILNHSSKHFLASMLEVVGISEKLLDENDKNTGGAQYVLKKIDVSFWNKLESDSEKLFDLMNQYNEDRWIQEYQERKVRKGDFKGIQAWCADMWALLWNLWLIGKKVEISRELDFTWPNSPINEWYEKAIQHYSGGSKDPEKFFDKTVYLNYDPWFDNSLRKISDKYCSYEIVQWIGKKRAILEKNRISFSDCKIVIFSSSMDANILRAFLQHKCYIEKFLDINICLMCMNTLEEDKYPDVLHRRELCCQLINETKAFNYLFFEVGVILNYRTIQNLCVRSFTNGVSFYLKNGYTMDVLFEEIFSKLLDFELIEQNFGKLQKYEYGKEVHLFDRSSAIRFLQDEMRHNGPMKVIEDTFVVGN